MTTSELFKAVLGYEAARIESIYIVVDRVLLRIADHQANNVNFECFNDVEDYDAIVNVVISNEFVDESKFETYLDRRNINGQMIVVSESDNVADTAEYILNTIKGF
jgi:hypothetical protein